jgi:hypothetical protein
MWAAQRSSKGESFKTSQGSFTETPGVWQTLGVLYQRIVEKFHATDKA